MHKMAYILQSYIYSQDCGYGGERKLVLKIKTKIKY